MQRATKPRLSGAELYETRYKNARMNLLMVFAFTLINIVLLITNSNLYFLFSASIPQYIASIAMYMCGKFPSDYYTPEELEAGFLDDSVFIVFIAVAIILTLFYLLSWFMSDKKHVGWLIFSLVLFSLDTIAMLLLYGISFDIILDILFHGWVLYYLISGVSAHFKLKKLPPEEEVQEEAEYNEETAETEGASKENSPVLREADSEAKHKVLLSATYLSYDICYRRVGRTNELVINGNVYDEYTALVEFDHTLSATIDGHSFEAGYANATSFIIADGELVAKKLRLL